MEKQYFDLVIKDLSGELTSEEKKMLSQWMPGNEEKYREWKELWEKSYLQEEFSVNENQAWDRLKTRIEKEAKPKWNIFRNRYLQVAAAALIVLSASLYVFLSEEKKEIIASNEHVEIFYLPDSTQVWLNKDSKLTIENFGSRERKVLLIGEAYFKVKRDPQRPFIILAGNSMTRVLGTEFLLKAHPESGKVEIDVQSGVVEFRNIENRSEAVYLIKDELATLDESTQKINKYSRTYTEEKWLVKAEARTVPKTEPESKVHKEISKPKEYLHHDFKWRDNFIRQAVVEGEIGNRAIFTSYKNVKLKATYYIKDKTKVEYYKLTQDIIPGDVVKYKFRLGNWFKRASKVEVSIDDAHAIQ